jgi:hypothetical protein
LGLPVEPLVKSQMAGSSRWVSALVRPRVADHEQVPEVGEALPQRVQPLERRRLHDRDLRPRVLEIVEVLLGRQGGVHHRDHGADLGRSEPGEGELGAVGQHDQHAVLGPDPERAQSIAQPVGGGLHLAVGEGLLPPVQAPLVAAALLDVPIEEVPGHVEALR